MKSPRQKALEEIIKHQKDTLKDLEKLFDKEVFSEDFCDSIMRTVRTLMENSYLVGRNKSEGTA